MSGTKYFLDGQSPAAAAGCRSRKHGGKYKPRDFQSKESRVHLLGPVFYSLHVLKMYQYPSPLALPPPGPRRPLASSYLVWASWNGMGTTGSHRTSDGVHLKAVATAEPPSSIHHGSIGWFLFFYPRSPREHPTFWPPHVRTTWPMPSVGVPWLLRMLFVLGQARPRDDLGTARETCEHAALRGTNEQ